MAVRVFARQYPLALFHDASEPEDKRQIDRHGRCEKHPAPIPAHRPLKQDGKPVGAPESQRHQNQAKQGVHLAFNSPDAALYIVIHLMSWLSGRACEGMQPPAPNASYDSGKGSRTLPSKAGRAGIRETATQP